MKKYFGLAWILIISLCVILCGCERAALSPWSAQISLNIDGKPKTLNVYVYGAVENEGYYAVEEDETYFVAIRQAGILGQSYLAFNAYSIVDGNQLSITVPYVENGAVRACINVNHESILNRRSREELSDTVINKIADYVQANGKITDKSVLRNVLDDDYENYHYKLYVAEADYEKAD